MSDWVKFSDRLPPLGVPIYVAPVPLSASRARYMLEIAPFHWRYVESDSYTIKVEHFESLLGMSWMYCGGHPGEKAINEGTKRAAHILRVEKEMKEEIRTLMGV